MSFSSKHNKLLFGSQDVTIVLTYIQEFSLLTQYSHYLSEFIISESLRSYATSKIFFYTIKSVAT